MLQFGDLYYINTPFYGYYQAPNSLWNQCNAIEKDILNAMDYKLITAMAPKFKLEVLKRQYGPLKNLYNTRRKLTSLLKTQKIEKYKQKCIRTNNRYIYALLSWNTLAPSQRFLISLQSFYYRFKRKL